MYAIFVVTVHFGIILCTFVVGVFLYRDFFRTQACVVTVVALRFLFYVSVLHFFAVNYFFFDG